MDLVFPFYPEQFYMNLNNFTHGHYSSSHLRTDDNAHANNSGVWIFYDYVDKNTTDLNAHSLD